MSKELEMLRNAIALYDTGEPAIARLNLRRILARLEAAELVIENTEKLVPQLTAPTFRPAMIEISHMLFENSLAAYRALDKETQ